MITLGIDPGFARCGYAFIESKNSSYGILDSGLIETLGDKPHNQRLKLIYDSLNDLITKYNPDNAAIEELFFSKNGKTAIKVAEARGVIILALTVKGVDFKEYKPKEVKSRITGNGNADKEAVIKMVNLFTGTKIIQDDAADAAAIALAHASRNEITQKEILQSFRISR